MDFLLAAAGMNVFWWVRICLRSNSFPLPENRTIVLTYEIEATYVYPWSTVCGAGQIYMLLYLDEQYVDGLSWDACYIRLYFIVMCYAGIYAIDVLDP